MTVTEALNEKLRENGWKQCQMARELKLSQSFLHRLLSGERKAGHIGIRKIAARFPELAPVLLGQEEAA
jgi:transcriptional regulator with XRE-family HTH domain